MIAALKQAGIKKAVDIGWFDRTIGHPAPTSGLDLDHRLEPIEAARAVADDLGVKITLVERFAIRMASLSAPSATAPESPGM
jgi:hypothetical protein